MATLSGADVDGGADGDEIRGSGDHAALRGHGGEDTIFGSPGSDSLGTGDVIDGGRGGDLIFDSEGDDFITGKGGADTLFASEGDNTIQGSGGDDVLVLTGGTYFSVSVYEGGAGDDTILVSDIAGSAFRSEFSGFEHIVLDSPSAQIWLRESQIIDPHGDNKLSVSVDSHGPAFPAQNQLAIGIDGDRLNLSHLVLENWQAGAVVFGMGSASPDTMVGSAYGDVLQGYEGDDLLKGRDGNDVLDGRQGADTMRGGHGDDGYIVEDAGDLIFETGTGGVDRVLSYISFELGKHVENLTLSGADALNGTGNRLDNAIRGNANANVLDGGRGADTLTGGDGQDVFRFSAQRSEADVDHVTDFVSGADKVALASALFVGLAPGALAAEAFRMGVEAQAPSDRILYDDQTGALYFDADGSGSEHAALRFATLDGAPALTGADFTVV